jgi:hypothetical protein
MIHGVQAVTLIWLTIALIISVRRIGAGDRSTILPVFLVFYVLFALPLLYDLLFGLPSYLEEPGFDFAQRDATVDVIYCLFAALVPIIWSRFLRKNKNRNFRSEDALARIRKLRFVLVIALFLPIVLIGWAPDPALYLTYAFALTDNVGKTVTDVSQFHSYVTSASLVATIAAAGLVVGARRPWRCLMFITPFVAAAVWVNGKRAIVAVAVVTILAALWLGGKLSRRKLLAVAGASVLFVACFSISYQLVVRDFGRSLGSSQDLYENVRVDFARDSRVKMAIFAELYPSSMSILDFRGQSLLFDATAYIPRRVWPGKPLTYQCYFTSAMIGSSPQDWGWGMTTSIFDEGIANGSWFGLLAATLVIGFLCRLGDSCSDLLIFLLTALVASLLLAVELVAIAPLFLIWLTMIIRAKIKFA